MPITKDRPDQQSDTDFDAWEKELASNQEPGEANQGSSEPQSETPAQDPKKSHKLRKARTAQKIGSKLNNIRKGLKSAPQSGAGATTAGEGGAAAGTTAAGEGAAATGAAASEGALATGAGAAAGEGAVAAGTTASGAAVAGGTAAAGGTVAAGGAAAAGGTAAAGGAAAAGTATVVVAAESNPVGPVVTVIIIIGIFLLILFVFFIVLIFVMITAAQAKEAKDAAGQQVQTLTLTKTGPDTAKMGDSIVYTINVTDTRQLQDLTIVDHLPADVTFVSASNNGKHDPVTKTVRWAGPESFPVENGALKQSTFALTLTVKASKDNVYDINWAEANSTYVPGAEGIAPGTSGEYTAPTKSDCNGKYNYSKWPERNPLTNFGDPLCNFSKAKLAALIVSLDPPHKHEWYDVIIKRETGGTYSPNSWAPPLGQQAAIDAGGAWGLYQMGSSKPPGKAPPAPGKNGPNDRGDVNWEMQTENAIKYNKNLIKRGCDWWYWRSARAGEIPGAKSC